MDTATLGVVMPVYNEPEVGQAVDALRAAAARAQWPLAVVVVDDGSTDGTGRTLDELASAAPITVVHQPNRGRFAARLAGLQRCETDLVLLLDARVILAPDSLTFLRAQLLEDDHSAWNAHVDVDTDGNLWAAFWSGLTKIGWRRYFADPRPVSFGAEDFDSYPKGTGAFVAPRAALLAAAGEFSSLFADERLASDDTRLLRRLAQTRRIRIDPRFRCMYHGRSTPAAWLRQGYRRGTTFVDGYVGSRRRALLLLGLAGPALTGGSVLLLRRPAPVLTSVVAGSVAAGVAARRSGGDHLEARAVAVLLPAFALAFGGGFLRGLAKAGLRR